MGWLRSGPGPGLVSAWASRSVPGSCPPRLPFPGSCCPLAPAGGAPLGSQWLHLGDMDPPPLSTSWTGGLPAFLTPQLTLGCGEVDLVNCPPSSGSACTWVLTSFQSWRESGLLLSQQGPFPRVCPLSLFLIGVGHQPPHWAPLTLVTLGTGGGLSSLQPCPLEEPDPRHAPCHALCWVSQAWL